MEERERDSIIYRALTCENEIRFYYNETTYVSGSHYGTEEMLIQTKKVEESEEVVLKEVKLASRILECFLKAVLQFVLIFALASIIAAINKIILAEPKFVTIILLSILVLAANVVWYLMALMEILLLKKKDTSANVKSKHAAEHMVCNFIDRNQRLPKDISELKTMSRYLPLCGNRVLVEKLGTNFVKGMLSTIMAILVSVSISVTTILIYLSIYFCIRCIVNNVTGKSKKFEILVEKFTTILSYIVQTVSTTKKVKDEDLILAYCVAREWLEEAYPEFYNQDDEDA